MPNRLQHEKSLYLRQHAENPVDWYPWGEEAFAKAKAEDKPLLISIGYASCHWCHVMAHESFESDYIAKLMNARFVCVKVDREERPDVDQIYMDAVQMLNGHGGWPLNVFCLPDGSPFAGGTYFPPDESRGHQIVPWPQLLMRIADFYERQRSDLEENATAILHNMEATNSPHQATGDAIGKGDYLLAMDRLLDNQDAAFGGFGNAPKFPPSMALDFLLAMRASATVELNYPNKAEAIDGCINRTLTGMAHGGLFDQIGGGFSRYSVDQHWLIPHFEKMLYDNALLLDIYTKAFHRYPKALYRQATEETIGWLQREMQSPDSAFYAALDADTDGEEGRTYTWTPSEVISALGEDEGNRFCSAYGITPEGNFENTGRSNPALLEGDPAIRDEFADARARLLALRNTRPQPGRDDKCLTAWNALLLRGLARAAFSFGEPEWLESAIRIAEWIWSTMRTEDNRLHSVAYENTPTGHGHLDDYAYSAEAFLALSAVVDWLHPGTADIWQSRAESLIKETDKHFSDPSAVGYFFTSDDHPTLIHRKKVWFDNATPSGNASLLNSFSTLAALTGEAAYAQAVERLKVAYPGIANTAPAAASHAMASLVYDAIGIAVIKVGLQVQMEPLRQALATRPWRPVYLRVDENIAKNSFQLCIGTQCLAPTDQIEELIEHL